MARKLSQTTISDIVDRLQKGQIGIFPCDTIWGIIGPMTSDAVKKIHAVKNRKTPQPFIVLIPNMDWLPILCKDIPETHQDFIQSVWPGPTSLIFTKDPSVPDSVTANRNTIAVRLAKFAPLEELFRGYEHPIISTSANVSGAKPSLDKKDIPDSILTQVDFSYGAADPGTGQESRVIDCTQAEPTIIRSC